MPLSFSSPTAASFSKLSRLRFLASTLLAVTAGSEEAGTGDEELAMVLEPVVDLAEDDATWMLGKNASPSPSSSDVVVSELISLTVDRDVPARLGVATLMVDEEDSVRR
jgi:hypothetical protein